MKRGDIVVAAAAGDYGKPRPAVVIQTDAFPQNHASVIICKMTTDIAHAPDFRLTIEPNESNGLRELSQIMADKPVTVRRPRIAKVIGQLGVEDVRRLNTALAFVLGLAD